jgi:hypothetical protein
LSADVSTVLDNLDDLDNPPFGLLLPLQSSEHEEVLHQLHSPLHVAVARAKSSTSSMTPPFMHQAFWDTDEAHRIHMQTYTSCDLHTHLSIMEEITTVLEDDRVDNNSINRGGQTALMLAAERGLDDAFSLMVDNGVDTTFMASPFSTKTVHQYARERWDDSRDARSYVAVPLDQILGKLHTSNGEKHDFNMRVVAACALMIQLGFGEQYGQLPELVEMILMHVLPKHWEHKPYEYGKTFDHTDYSDATDIGDMSSEEFSE